MRNQNGGNCRNKKYRQKKIQSKPKIETSLQVAIPSWPQKGHLDGWVGGIGMGFETSD
jgi:hypothetical protein